jgi:photosystem II stability/assembly factor-like uncharacterized protein
LEAVSQTPEPANPSTRRSGSLLWGTLLLLAALLLAALQSPYPDAYGTKNWFDWLKYPLERNTPKRLLKVEGAINDIAFAKDGQRGFAVGDGGLVLATDDGGQNWREVFRENRFRRLRALALSPSSNSLAAVGDRGSVIMSADSGVTWKPVPLATIDDIVAVASIQDSGQFFAFGSLGAGYRFNASGVESVVVVLTPRRNTPRDARIATGVFSTDSKSGWAGGAEGLIYETRDGGQNWRLAETGPSGSTGGGFSFADPQPLPGPASYLPRDVAGLRVAAIAAPSKGPSGAGEMVQQPVYEDPKLQSRAVPAPDNQVRPSPTRVVRQKTATPARNTVKPKAKPRTVAPVARKNALKAEAETIPSPPPPPIVEAKIRRPVRRLIAFDQGPNLEGIRDPAMFVLDVLGSPDAEVPIWSDGATARDLAFANHSVGWIVGDGGRIAGTGDGGSSWTPRLSGVTSQLNAIALSPADERLWAAGEGGTLISSSDGGASWVAQLRRTDIAEPEGSYGRFPAPWFYAALLASAFLIFRGARPVTVKTERGAAAIGASDAPTATMDQDRLGFASLARGISRYLRNQATTPPMTLAISGDWGTGKSSLMQLVCEDLRAHGNRPVWFNAWHHQDEEQLLAALLAAIRDKALPHWWTPAGLQFRAHLFWLRANRALPTTLLLTGLIVMLVAYFTSHDVKGWATLGRFFAELFGDGPAGADLPNTAQLGGSVAKVAAQLGALFAVIRGLRGAMKSFGTDPAVLLTGTIDNFKLRDASAQVNFRTRFQTQFEEVTAALPYPLVIVIDDLDRCRPETVLSVMESVNFLMSSGPCFVMFGMATQRVQAALAMSFKEIALELVEVDKAPGDAPSEADREQVAREKRQKYAGDYLQKLINLEIRVPTRADIAPHLLLIQASTGKGPHWLRVLAGRIGKFWPLVPVALVIAAAWSLGQSIEFGKEADVEVVAPLTAAPAGVPNTTTNGPPAELADGNISNDAAAIDGPKTKSAAALPVKVTPGDDGRGADWPLFALLGLMLGGLALWQVSRKRERHDVRDSDAFIDALQIWTPVVAHKASAPRAIKRFGNRLRYFAMLQQAEVPEPTPEERAEAWLKKWLPGEEGDDAAPSQQRVDVVAEHRIVALGAIQSVYGERWRQRIEDAENMDFKIFEKAFENPADEKLYDQEVLTNKALEDYARATGASWPPSPEELDAFDRSVKGIRLRGDIQVLSDQQASSTASPNANFKK